MGECYNRELHDRKRGEIHIMTVNVAMMHIGVVMYTYRYCVVVVELSSEPLFANSIIVFALWFSVFLSSIKSSEPPLPVHRMH